MSRLSHSCPVLTGLLILLAAGTIQVVSPLLAQQAGGNNQGGNNQGGNNQGGNNQGRAAGIIVDAEGLVKLATVPDTSGTLDHKHREAALKKNSNSDLTASTKTRYVSLVALERVIKQLVSESKPIPDEVFYLAGLQRVDEVLVLADDGDLVIAGPAEGYAADPAGRMTGIVSSRPVLRLDDLVVALRTLIHSRAIGCSIDPDPARLADLQKFIKQGASTPASADVVEARFQQMDDILGLQNVRVDGVPPESHFSVALVEADYRMKLISVGLETPAVKGLKSHLSMIGAGGNAMQRWWFVPLYDGIYRSRDGLAFRFAGPRAQLLAEEELADAQGNRVAAPTTRVSTKAFAKLFTEKFPELAAKSPVFGELQNLIDWAVFAALLQKERLPERIGWTMATLLDEKQLAIPTFNAPKKIPSVVNYKPAGSQIVGLVGGGVSVEPTWVLRKMVSPADDPQLEKARERAMSASRIETHRWWWDGEAAPDKPDKKGRKSGNGR